MWCHFTSLLQIATLAWLPQVVSSTAPPLLPPTGGLDGGAANGSWLRCLALVAASELLSAVAVLLLWPQRMWQQFGGLWWQFLRGRGGHVHVVLLLLITWYAQSCLLLELTSRTHSNVSNFENQF
jgi:hypothetical protein